MIQHINIFVDIIKSLCVILPQMDGYIKYFDNGGKNMSFATDDKKVYEKYDGIWNVIKGLLKLNIFKKKNIATFNNNNIVPMEKKSLYLYFCNRY